MLRDQLGEGVVGIVRTKAEEVVLIEIDRLEAGVIG